jgi:hypothetical protein
MAQAASTLAPAYADDYPPYGYPVLFAPAFRAGSLRARPAGSRHSHRPLLR